jgi:hypothetical protein
MHLYEIIRGGRLNDVVLKTTRSECKTARLGPIITATPQAALLVKEPAWEKRSWSKNMATRYGTSRADFIFWNME